MLIPRRARRGGGRGPVRVVRRDGPVPPLALRRLGRRRAVPDGDAGPVDALPPELAAAAVVAPAVIGGVAVAAIVGVAVRIGRIRLLLPEIQIGVAAVSARLRLRPLRRLLLVAAVGTAATIATIAAAVHGADVPLVCSSIAALLPTQPLTTAMAAESC